MKTLLETLNESERKLLKIKTFKKDAIIYYEDDECDSIGIVIFGLINISSFSYHGNEIVFNHIGPNEIFGENLLFSDDKKYRGNVISKSNSEIAFISKANLEQILGKNVLFLREYLRLQSNFAKKLNSTIKLLSFDSAEERLLYYLFINNNQVRFNTVTKLAEKLNLKRETVSRLLSKLVDEKVIVKANNFIRINK